MVLAGVLLVVWTVCFPVVEGPPGLPSDHGPQGIATTAGRQNASTPDRDTLLTLAGTPLRQQLFDPPPPTAPPPPPTPPLPRVELISTLIAGNGLSSAWVREPAAGPTPRKVCVGDVLGPADNPATITAIEPGRLIVEHNGEVKPIERELSHAGRRQ